MKAKLENDSDHFWVFGYGSLMWNPGFEFVASCRAKMSGVHRAPCVFSWVHRGTETKPGIVLGLDRGGACVGTAFKVRKALQAETIDYLRARELVTNVYLETKRAAVLKTGERVETVSYLVDRHHAQYAGRLSHDQLIWRIKDAVGKSGPNDAYFLKTADLLHKMNIRDRLMERIARALREPSDLIVQPDR